MSSLPSEVGIGTYVYCVGWAEALADRGDGFRARSIGDHGDRIRVIPFMDLAAVVSDSPSPSYDIGRKNTMAHQLVVEEVMTRSEILPVRFSTVARTDEDVREKLLKRRFGELHYFMERIHGRVELGLKVLWNRERLFAEMTAENAPLRALRDFIGGRPVEETHYQRIQLGQMTEEAIIRKRDQEAEAILEMLRPLAVEVKINKILTDMMVLNAAFLVDKAVEPRFDAQVNAFDEAQKGRLILKYVGPVPPYNFVNIVMHWEED